MEVLPEVAHRTLTYIELVNQGGYYPSKANVNNYYMAAKPITRNVVSEIMYGLQETTLGTSREEPIKYLERLGWITEKGAGWRVTKLGTALLKSLRTQELAGEVTDDVIEAVLDVDDPFAYARAVVYLRTDEPSLLIDPYLRMEQAITLAAAPSVERVLVGKLNKADLASLADAANVIAQSRPFEVRRTDQLHDRYLIPRSGTVRMLGGSLNTIGHASTTITSLSTDVSDYLRRTYDALWASADAVVPAAPTDDDAGRGDSPS